MLRIYGPLRDRGRLGMSLPGSLCSISVLRMQSPWRGLPTLRLDSMGWVRLMADSDAVIQLPAQSPTRLRACRSGGTFDLPVLLLVPGCVWV